MTCSCRDWCGGAQVFLTPLLFKQVVVIVGMRFVKPIPPSVQQPFFCDCCGNTESIRVDKYLTEHLHIHIALAINPVHCLRLDLVLSSDQDQP